MTPEDLAAVGLRLDVDGPVATITLDRPEVRNAQTPGDVAGAGARSAPRCPTTSASWWSGATGDSFSAGLDRAMLDPGGAPRARRRVLGLLALERRGDLGHASTSYQRGFTWLRDPRFVSIAAVQGLRHRRRLPAGAVLRPAGGRRRRAVLHEGAGARPGARPDGNKAAGRERWLRQGAGDLRHRPDGRRRGGGRDRARHWPRSPPTSSTRPSPTSSAP